MAKHKRMCRPKNCLTRWQKSLANSKSEKLCDQLGDADSVILLDTLYKTLAYAELKILRDTLAHAKAKAINDTLPDMTLKQKLAEILHLAKAKKNFETVRNVRLKKLVKGWPIGGGSAN